MIEYQTGDLFEAGIPVLAHGVNLEGVMGSGIAVEFRKRWPKMYAEYQERCWTGALKLGRFHEWTAPDKSVTVFNLATQVRRGKHAGLPSLRDAVEWMLFRAEDLGIEAVAIPRIGAGIGGLDWPDVDAVLRRLAARSPVRLVVVTLPEAAR